MATEHAVDALTEALRPLGISPTLEERALDQAAFEGAPGESNRIWIAGRPLEDWLDASAGASQCCSVCGDNDCPTVTTPIGIEESRGMNAGWFSGRPLGTTRLRALTRGNGVGAEGLEPPTSAL